TQDAAVVEEGIAHQEAHGARDLETDREPRYGKDGEAVAAIAANVRRQRIEATRLHAHRKSRHSELGAPADVERLVRIAQGHLAEQVDRPAATSPADIETGLATDEEVVRSKTILQDKARTGHRASPGRHHQAFHDAEPLVQSEEANPRQPVHMPKAAA